MLSTDSMGGTALGPMPRPMLQAEGCAECRIEVKLEAPIQDDLAHVVLGAGAIATYGTYPFQ